MIQTIKHEELVFVFGSNLAGRHGKGAAHTAARFYGAEDGVGIGTTGNSYALPTKDKDLKTLPLDDIEEWVAGFLEYVQESPKTKFQVTRIGCGLAGYKDEDIFPMFKDAPPNVLLPGLWLDKMGLLSTPRCIIAGSRDFTAQGTLFTTCKSTLRNQPHWEIVSGTCKGPDRMGEEFAKIRGYDIMRMPAAWNKWGKPAGPLRNHAMAWYATHAIIFWDGKSKGTKAMIKYAEQEGLKVRVIQE